jgi:hypothetical protein
MLNMEGAPNSEQRCGTAVLLCHNSYLMERGSAQRVPANCHADVNCTLHFMLPTTSLAHEVGRLRLGFARL